MTLSREERRWQKFEEEERHFQYLKGKGYTSIDVADLLIHNMLEILKFGIKIQHPQYTERELLDHMRKIIDADKELKKTVRKERNGRV